MITRTRGHEKNDHIAGKKALAATFRAAGARLVVIEHLGTDVVALFVNMLVAGEVERSERNAVRNTMRNFMTGLCDLQITLAMSEDAHRRISNTLSRHCPQGVVTRVHVISPRELNAKTISRIISSIPIPTTEGATS